MTKEQLVRQAVVLGAPAPGVPAMTAKEYARETTHDANRWTWMHATHENDGLGVPYGGQQNTHVRPSGVWSDFATVSYLVSR